MVNKFGECTTGTTCIGVFTKVTKTSGKYTDYGKQIQESYKLGFTPYRLHTNYHGVWVTPVRNYNGYIYALDDQGALHISNRTLKEDTSVLVYAVEEDGGSIEDPPGEAGIQGERGSDEVKRNPGPQGKRRIGGEKKAITEEVFF